MAPKTKEQFTVICESIFLNDTKPEKWTQTFAWKPSVSFHYKVLDDTTGEVIDEVEKKYLKDLWLFQAMGGQNAKGRMFKLQAEHGEVPAKEGQPAKPYVTVMPIAEVFADGSARFLEPPKNGKVSVPSKAPSPPPPLAAKPTAAAKTTAAIPTEPATPGLPQQDRNTAKAEGFFRELDKAQSDPWWVMKTQMGYDGADATNVLDFAKHLTVMECAGMEGSTDELRAKAESVLDYWCRSLRTRLLTMKYANIRDRLSHYLNLCTTVKDLDKILYKSWVELPMGDFDALRSEAVDRMKVIQGETEAGVFKGKIKVSLQPEIPEMLRPILTEEEEPQAAAAPATPGPSTPAVEQAVVDFTRKAIMKCPDFNKLLELWATSSPGLQKHPAIIMACADWVSCSLRDAQYQQQMDGVLERVPKGWYTPELMIAWQDRYSNLAPF